MPEALRYPERAAIVPRQFDGDMLAKAGRIAAQIDGNIEHGAMRDPDQLSLRIDGLVVDAADYIFLRDRKIVLNPRAGKPRRFKCIVIPGLPESAAIVAVDPGRNQEYAGE